MLFTGLNAVYLQFHIVHYYDSHYTIGEPSISLKNGVTLKVLKATVSVFPSTFIYFFGVKCLPRYYIT